MAALLTYYRPPAEKRAAALAAEAHSWFGGVEADARAELRRSERSARALLALADTDQSRRRRLADLCRQKSAIRRGSALEFTRALCPLRWKACPLRWEAAAAPLAVVAFLDEERAAAESTEEEYRGALARSEATGRRGLMRHWRQDNSALSSAHCREVRLTAATRAAAESVQPAVREAAITARRSEEQARQQRCGALSLRFEVRQHRAGQLQYHKAEREWAGEDEQVQRRLLEAEERFGRAAARKDRNQWELTDALAHRREAREEARVQRRRELLYAEQQAERFGAEHSRFAQMRSRVRTYECDDRKYLCTLERAGRREIVEGAALAGLVVCGDDAADAAVSAAISAVAAIAREYNAVRASEVPIPDSES